MNETEKAFCQRGHNEWKTDPRGRRYCRSCRRLANRVLNRQWLARQLAERPDAYRAAKRAYGLMYRARMKREEPERWRAIQARRNALAIPQRRKQKFGLYSADFFALLDRQGNRCAICRITFSRPLSAFTDHCHKSGRVRGLLCLKCNSGIGYLRDSPAIIRNASAYLEIADAIRADAGIE